MENTNSINVLEALVSNNRSELGKTFPLRKRQAHPYLYGYNHPCLYVGV